MNRVVHFEITAEDVERASKFYRSVFGWKIEPWGPPEYGYMHVETGSSSEPGIDGGIWKGAGAAPAADARLNAFNCSIEVADIDITLSKVKSSGGMVVREKSQIPGVGWLAMCRDTEGNTFGVMQR
ncbi:VOC family protein [Dawidia soli]|uniref:VOC family protein n=1 Tax=Dawidia soli TaxID=2782352 RepID=A0AAP2GL68_9BACT|nr:VOC family protein [Dawidia soli]MBT1689798.1 VOC family protein [Dawidia soli]